MASLSYRGYMARGRAPWHERSALLARLRGRLRRALFGFLGKVAATDDAKGILASSLSGLVQPKLPRAIRAGNLPPPYPDLGDAALVRAGAGAIFITARFRSGSTLLWNLFRNVEGCTAYYEPLNERRWFDPATRGDFKDPTHRHVADYWREYEGLEALGDYYRQDWIDRNLFMDADFWDPDLKRYCELLIEKAPGRPVLQFNRIDFRLPWFRRNFPGARIVHLYRHPRDQWCSVLRDLRAFPKEGTMRDFAPHDHFYLRNWAKDLKYPFPFLDKCQIAHPYQMFYYIWKLSYLFGIAYAGAIRCPKAIAGQPRGGARTEILRRRELFSYLII